MFTDKHQENKQMLNTQDCLFESSDIEQVFNPEVWEWIWLIAQRPYVICATEGTWLLQTVRFMVVTLAAHNLEHCFLVPIFMGNLTDTFKLIVS